MRYRQILATLGSALWDLVNCNDKINNAYFKELKDYLLSRSILKTFLFDSSNAPRPQYRDTE